MIIQKPVIIDGSLSVEPQIVGYCVCCLHTHKLTNCVSPWSNCDEKLEEFCRIEPTELSEKDKSPIVCRVAWLDYKQLKAFGAPYCITP
jgi:hypothetical protein